MNKPTSVKEELVETDEYDSENKPVPMEKLHSAGPPPFLTKTYEMVENPETDDVVSWSEARNSFIVWDYIKLSSLLLPKYFKHNNFSSFIRQLNTYGFKKVDPDRYEFANERFLGGQRHLLRTIKRRRHVGTLSWQQQGRPAGARGIADELGMLEGQGKTLVTDVLGLKRQQIDVNENMIEMHERLLKTEKKQQQMVSFLSRALNNPLALEQLLDGCAKRRELCYGGFESRKKRRLSGCCNLENVAGKRQRQAEELMNERELEIESLFGCNVENDKSSLETVGEEDGGDNYLDYVNEELVDWDNIDDEYVQSGDGVDMKISVEDLVCPTVFESDDDIQDLFDRMNYVC